MRWLVSLPGIWTGALLLSACSSSVETVKPPTPGEVKEMLFKKGHQLYVDQQYDSASAVLKRALEVDRTYLPPMTDLAEMHYALALRETGEASPAKREHLKQAQEYFSKIEALGRKDTDLYERLCEVAYGLKDDNSFLKYAKKNADAYPYARQYFNLGIAYYNVGDYQSVIRTQKAATEKFRTSSFIGSFYKQLGRAYMKVNRDQTAERTFVAGVQAVDAQLGELKKVGGEYRSSDDERRLVDDKIAILLFLKKLHQTYDEKIKLEKVERQLREAGYSK